MKKNLHIRHAFARILTMLLFLAIGMTAYSQTYTRNGIIYELYVKQVPNNVIVYFEVVGHTSDLPANVRILESITHQGRVYNVAHINASAFSGCTSLTSITIPKTVSYIGSSAFFE